MDTFEWVRYYNDSNIDIELILVRIKNSEEYRSEVIVSIKPGAYKEIPYHIICTYDIVLPSEILSEIMYLTVGGVRKLCIRKDDLLNCNEIRFFSVGEEFTMQKVGGNSFGRLGIGWMLKDFSLKLDENIKKVLNIAPKENDLGEPLLSMKAPKKTDDLGEPLDH